MHLVDSLSCGGAGIGLDAGWWQRRVCGSWQWSHGAAPIGRPAAPLIQGHSILVPLPFNFDGNLMLISKIESYMVILRMWTYFAIIREEEVRVKLLA
jgi:hypothetical protein